MRMRYDGHTDILTIVLRDARVAESDAGRPGVVLDYDRSGNLLRIEVHDASTRVDDPLLPWQHALRAPGHVGLHLLDAGHLPQLEDPDTVARIIEATLLSAGG